MDFADAWNEFWRVLYSDIPDSEEYWNVRPLLAHYTSMQNLENILKGEQVWLSNPLFMNDLEEARFGVNYGFEIMHDSPDLRDALGEVERQNIFFHYLNSHYEEYSREKVLDLYVMCFSEHEPKDVDGRLSMWRGYGSNGNGVALVFDTGKMAVVNPNPLALAKVQYGTVGERRGWLETKVGQVAEFLKKTAVPDEHLGNIAIHLFQWIITFSVFAKHKGFEEEREWRLVYLQHRDPDNVLKSMFSYANGVRGIEPKLKLKISPLDGVISEDFSLSDITHSIVLGPTISTPLTEMSVRRMLDAIGKPELKGKLRSSTLPFRSN